LAPPLLGEHSADVLQLGLSQHDIEGLTREKIIKRRR
jgi:hypothetical protein